MISSLSLILNHLMRDVGEIFGSQNSVLMILPNLGSYVVDYLTAVNITLPDSSILKGLS